MAVGPGRKETSVYTMVLRCCTKNIVGRFGERLPQAYRYTDRKAMLFSRNKESLGPDSH